MDSPDYSRSLLQRLTGQRSDIPLTLNSLSTLVSESPAFDVLPMSDITNKKTVEHIEGNEKVHIQLDVSQVSGDCDESSFRLNESSDLLDVAFVNTTQMEICNKNIEDDSIDGSELVESDDISRESGSGASISSSKSVRISETPTMPTLATSPAGTSGVNYGRGSKSPERKLSIQDISIDDAEELYSSDISASGRRLTIRRRRVPGSRCKRITMQNLSHTQLQVTESIVTPHGSVRFTPERSRLGGVSMSPATMSTVPPPTTLTEVAGFSGSMQDTSQVTTPPTASECHAATPTNISNSRTTPSSAPSFETTSSSASSSNTTPTNVPHLGIKPTCDYRTFPSATISEPTSAGVSGCVTHPILPSNNVTPTSTPIQVPDITALEEKYGDLPCGPDVEPVVRKSKRRRTADFEITSQIVSPPSTTNSPADTDTVILPVLRTRQSRRLKRKSLELYTYDKSASTRRGSSTGEKKIKTPAKRQIVTEEDKPCSTTLYAVVEESSPTQSSSKTQIQPVTISQNISTETPSKNSIVSQVADEATERKTDLNLTAELENEEVLSGNLKRKTVESTHSSVQDCESSTSLRSGIDQETEDIYFNRLWESQMPQPKQWETIFEQPKCSKKATQIFGTKSITCKIDFDDFSSRPRVLSRRRRAAKRGFKLPTKRRFAQLQTRLELMDKIQDHNEESVIPEKITKPAKTPATPTRRSNRQQRNT